MGTMKVNFNGVRKQALYAYEDLCIKLNNAINDGMISIHAGEIKKDMDNLKINLGVIAMTFDPEVDDFDDVFDEVYGEEESMMIFNPK